MSTAAMVLVVESIDKSAAQRLLDAEIWSEHVLHDMRKKLLDWGRIVVLAAGLPLVVVVFSSELHSTNTPWRLCFQLVAVAVLVTGVLSQCGGADFSLQVQQWPLSPEPFYPLAQRSALARSL